MLRAPEPEARDFDFKRDLVVHHARFGRSHLLAVEAVTEFQHLRRQSAQRQLDADKAGFELPGHHAEPVDREFRQLLHDHAAVDAAEAVEIGIRLEERHILLIEPVVDRDHNLMDAFFDRKLEFGDGIRNLAAADLAPVEPEPRIESDSAEGQPALPGRKMERPAVEPDSAAADPFARGVEAAGDGGDFVVHLHGGNDRVHIDLVPEPGELPGSVEAEGVAFRIRRITSHGIFSHFMNGVAVSAGCVLLKDSVVPAENQGLPVIFRSPFAADFHRRKEEGRKKQKKKRFIT